MKENTATLEANKKDAEKLVQKQSISSFVDSVTKQARTKKQPQATIRPHNVKGRTYYCYRKGGREIYLGDADSILAKVKGKV